MTKKKNTKQTGLALLKQRANLTKEQLNSKFSKLSDIEQRKHMLLLVGATVRECDQIVV